MFTFPSPESMKRLIPKRVQLRRFWFFRIFGKTIFHADLWSFRPRAVAGGVALGLFVGCTPTYGIQMPLVAVLAFVLRVNLPLGLASTWITNPVTAPLVYYFCYHLGVILLGNPPVVAEPGPLGEELSLFLQVAKPLWIGSLFVGTFVSTLGYLLSLFVWWAQSRIRRRKIGRSLTSVDTKVETNSNERIIPMHASSTDRHQVQKETQGESNLSCPSSTQD